MIIDTHVHFGESLDFKMTKEMVIESMKKYNIDYALVSSIGAVEFDHELKPIPDALRQKQNEVFCDTIKFAREYPHRIGIYPWIEPYNETADEEFKKLLKDNLDIVHGIKLHQFHSKTPADSTRMEPYIKLAQEYNLPIVCHTGGCEEAGVIHVYNAAKKHPEVNFVMVHMGLGTDNQEAIELLGKLPNLYGDTTWVPIESTVQAVKLYGSEKIFFGSDNPIDGVDTYHNNPKGEKSVYQKYFNELEELIGKENYDNIMFKNAKRVFNIKHIFTF